MTEYDIFCMFFACERNKSEREGEAQQIQHVQCWVDEVPAEMQVWSQTYVATWVCVVVHVHPGPPHTRLLSPHQPVVCDVCVCVYTSDQQIISNVCRHNMVYTTMLTVPIHTYCFCSTCRVIGHTRIGGNTATAADVELYKQLEGAWGG